MALTAHEIQIIGAAQLLLETLLKGAASHPGPAAGPEVADDRDLDGKYGNPVVKFHPRDWHGESMKGRAMSDCSAEFLEMLAGTFDYFAKKAEESGETASNGRPVAPYKRRDAARARGWASRVRGGYVSTATGEMVDPPAAPSSFDDGSEWPPVAEMTDSDIPF
jgi:hypothetical protein